MELGKASKTKWCLGKLVVSRETTSMGEVILRGVGFKNEMQQGGAAGSNYQVEQCLWKGV